MCERNAALSDCLTTDDLTLADEIPVNELLMTWIQNDKMDDKNDVNKYDIFIT